MNGLLIAGAVVVFLWWKAKRAQTVVTVVAAPRGYVDAANQANPSPVPPANYPIVQTAGPVAAQHTPPVLLNVPIVQTPVVPVIPLMPAQANTIQQAVDKSVVGDIQQNLAIALKTNVAGGMSTGYGVPLNPGQGSILDVIPAPVGDPVISAPVTIPDFTNVTPVAGYDYGDLSGGVGFGGGPLAG